MKMRTNLKWGRQVAILPGKWGPKSPYYRDNREPGSPFSQKYGDPFTKMTPCMADRFPKSICLYGRP